VDYENPFALARASDYTIDQINSFWVEMGDKVVDAIIEPRSRQSKYILGGKGTGKTHLLRYFSYPAAQKRHGNLPGLDVLRKQGFLAVFLRATGLDAARFEMSSTSVPVWQQVFAAYLELRLVDMVLDAISDIQATTQDEKFNDNAFLTSFGDGITDEAFKRCSDVASFRHWVASTRKALDNAINNAAFTGKLEASLPFAIGALCLKIGPALGAWHHDLENLPLIYLIDEIENFSASQQQVVNSLIRYGEGSATFRVTGRLYAIRTLATLGDGEPNRDGSEFKRTILDEIIAEFKSYPDFARRFVVKRLTASKILDATRKKTTGKIDPAAFFEGIDSSNFYSGYLIEQGIDPEATYVKRFVSALTQGAATSQLSKDIVEEVVELLVRGLPFLIGKLNLLLFSKKLKTQDPIQFAGQLRAASEAYFHKAQARGYYATAYGHYSGDLFAQLCRDAKSSTGVVYAGFDTFVKMSAGNPRNLLIILGRIFEISTFKGVPFDENRPLPVSLQTEGVDEAARFIFESDANYGSRSDRARVAVSRLASVLRTARFALNIPEVAPLSVSFADDELAESAVETLHSALNYSLVFEIPAGRPDRNSQKVLRKINLNPMLSPRWGLPVGRRGDLSLSSELANAIFDVERKDEFEFLLKSIEAKWNFPFGSGSEIGKRTSPKQTQLF